MSPAICQEKNCEKPFFFGFWGQIPFVALKISDNGVIPHVCGGVSISSEIEFISPLLWG
jgi:hypothetical protein